MSDGVSNKSNVSLAVFEELSSNVGKRLMASLTEQVTSLSYLRERSFYTTAAVDAGVE